MNKTITIRRLNPIFCEVSKEDHKLIRPPLSYLHVWYQQQDHGRVRKETWVASSKYLKSREVYHFHTGLLQRVRNFCVEKSIGIKLEGPPILRIPPIREIKVPGYDLRPDQIDLVNLACRRQRGYIIAPTRTGKTVVMMGIISKFPDETTLVLCHSKSIVSQTKERFEEVFTEKIGFIGQQRFELSRITVGTIQSAIKHLPPDKLEKFYDIVIVDETHHVSSFDGMYAQFFEGILSPVRLGFTATEPTRAVAKLALQAFTGPKIGEVTMDEAIELGLIVKPKIRVLKIPKNIRIHELRSWKRAYEEGIVNNRSRHRMVWEEVRKYLEDGKTVLILVRLLEHGRLMQEIGKAMGIESEYIHGAVAGDVRDAVQKAFNVKYVKCVIATAAWKEGIDIPTLDVVFNAAGGKDELPTIQSTARCLTKTDEKHQAIIHEVFDESNRYLTDHFAHRMYTYAKKGWL